MTPPAARPGVARRARPRVDDDPSRRARRAAIAVTLAACLLCASDSRAQVSVTPGALPAPVGGAPYSQTLVATGGTPPYSYLQVAGSLPAGLALDPASGTLAGTVTRPQAYDFVIYATDREGYEALVHASGTIASPVSFGPASLPSGVVGTPYAATLTASGGTPPYAYAIVAGTLPPGLALAADGTLSGVPTTSGSRVVTIEVTDAVGFKSSAARTVAIADVLGLAAGSLPPGVVGVAYAATLGVTGGTPPYGFALESGTLPPGLALSGGGSLGGTPTVAGSYPFAIRVTDANGLTVTGTRTVSIGAPVGLATGALPAATVGVAYALALAGQGGTPPYTFALASGALPPGLALAPTGTLAGTPTLPGSYPIGLRVTDANGFADTAARTLVVAPALRLVGTPPVARAGRAYAYTLVASGGAAPYTFALAGGSFPTGLTLAADGALAGTPRAAGTYTATLAITDALGNTRAVALVLLVSEDGIAVPTLGAGPLALLAALIALAAPLARRRGARASGR